MNFREGFCRLSLFAAILAILGMAKGQCAIQPIKPIPPGGCKDLIPQCVADSAGHASWTWSCISSDTETAAPSLSLPQLRTPPPAPIIQVQSSQNLPQPATTEPTAPSGIPVGQLSAAEQRAADQLRTIAESIKKCPPGVNPDSDTLTGSRFSSPINVVWDVERTSSFRSPLIGYIEFFMDSTYPLSKLLQCKKRDRECAARNQAIVETNMMVSAMPTLSLVRYEFDFGAQGLEFSRVIAKQGSGGESSWHPSHLGNGCEDKVILSVVQQ